jgi:xylulokinase
MYLGIDAGTSEIKTLLIDDRQQIIATAHAPLAISRLHSGWSEQDPAAWWQATQATIAELAARVPRELAAVRGIGLSGQMHGAVLLDASHQVLRPAILWNDVRSGAECAELERRVPRSRELTGNLAMPGFTAPKLLWVQRHEPEVFARTALVLLPKDYLRLMLTGEAVSDMSDAAGTLWLDVRRRDWSDEMLEATGLSRRHMPRLVEGSAPGGALRPELGRSWGMTERVVVAGGGGDNAASAIGMGVVAEGDAFLSLGTSGVLFVANDGYRPNPARGVHTFCHALPGRWHQMAVILSAASCLHWATRLLGAAGESALMSRIGTLYPASIRRAPLFLPYLSGERTPHNDPDARGVLFGLDHDSDAAAVGYAVIEGVAFALLDGYRALRDAGTTIRTAALVGGGSRSLEWARLLAAALDVPLRRHSGAEVGGALGAARLAMLAADPGRAIAEVCTAPPVHDVIAPEPELASVLQPRFERFRELYPALQPAFKRGAASSDGS